MNHHIYRASVWIALVSLLIAVSARADMDVSVFPRDASTAAPPDTPLRITFPAPPTLGTSGKITVTDQVHNDLPVETIDISVQTKKQTIGGLANFNYYPIIINGNEADIYLPNGALHYRTAYRVNIDPGTFTVGQEAFAGFTAAHGWHFQTTDSPPAKGTTHLTVAPDGTGDFCTLQGALDFIPDGNTTPTTIFLRKGTYTELIYFNNKNNVTIEGEDRKQSIIAYANNNRFNNASGVYHRGVFLAHHCNNLVLNNLTIRNTTPRGGSQAEAIILNGTTTSRALLTNVDLYSFQDTLQINGQAYLSNCYIEGDVDFMWGSGPCFFENCHCYGTRNKAYYTQIRNPPTNHGYVYYHCTFDGPAAVTDMYLARIAPAVFPDSEVVLIDCVLGDSVGGAGWLLNTPRGATTKPPVNRPMNIHFWEFNSHHADGTPVDVSKRLPVSRQLTQPQDAATIANYSDPTYVLGDNWNPRSALTTQPSQ